MLIFIAALKIIFLLTLCLVGAKFVRFTATIAIITSKQLCKLRKSITLI